MPMFCYSPSRFPFFWVIVFSIFITLNGCVLSRGLNDTKPLNDVRQEAQHAFVGTIRSRLMTSEGRPVKEIRSYENRLAKQLKANRLNSFTTQNNLHQPKSN